MNRPIKNHTLFSSLMLLGALTYGQHAAAGCADQGADQSWLVSQNFASKNFDSGSYFNGPTFNSRSCKGFIVDVTLNANSNNDGKGNQEVVFSSRPQYVSFPFGPAEATAGTCASYTLTEEFYAKEQGAAQFSLKDSATYKGVWVGSDLFAPSCQFATVKAPTIDWVAKAPLLGAPNSTYRIVTSLTEKRVWTYWPSVFTSILYHAATVELTEPSPLPVPR